MQSGLNIAILQISLVPSRFLLRVLKDKMRCIIQLIFLRITLLFRPQKSIGVEFSFNQNQKLNFLDVRHKNLHWEIMSCIKTGMQMAQGL